jgi:fumarate reductase subunit C
VHKTGTYYTLSNHVLSLMTTCHIGIPHLIRPIQFGVNEVKSRGRLKRDLLDFNFKNTSISHISSWPLLLPLLFLVLFTLSSFCVFVRFPPSSSSWRSKNFSVSHLLLHIQQPLFTLGSHLLSFFLLKYLCCCCLIFYCLLLIFMVVLTTYISTAIFEAKFISCSLRNPPIFSSILNLKSLQVSRLLTECEQELCPNRTNRTARDNLTNNRNQMDCTKQACPPIQRNGSTQTISTKRTKCTYLANATTQNNSSNRKDHENRWNSTNRDNPTNRTKSMNRSPPIIYSNLTRRKPNLIKLT